MFERLCHKNKNNEGGCSNIKHGDLDKKVNNNTNNEDKKKDDSTNHTSNNNAWFRKHIKYPHDRGTDEITKPLTKLCCGS